MTSPTPLRLGIATAIAMTAFAANSLLNRVAVGAGHMGAMDFALIRVAAGAVTLAGIASLGGTGWLRGMRAVNVAALAIYLVGFSLAYLALPAGAGALILFAAVQVTMFGGALAGSETIPGRRWVGAVLALTGLALMLLPGAGAVPLGAGIVMAVAGIGWGIYSLRGRAGGPPLQTTAASFAGALPVVLAARLLTGGAEMDGIGITLALVSGALTSGLGYALWYSVVPTLGASRAALAQLTVPVIAVAGGVILLGEALTPRLVLSSALVLGGVAFGLRSRG